MEESRPRRKPQGPKPLTREREEYFRLVDQGVGLKEACRIVGINYRTSKKWRNGFDGRTVPVHVSLHAKTARFLSEDERLQIADLLREGASVRAIASELGRSPSTISREIRRNKDPRSGRYRPHAAHALAQSRRPRPRSGKLARDPQLRERVQALLDEYWSPEQVAWALRHELPGQPGMHLAHETIYRAVYRRELSGLRCDPVKVLRTRRPRRKHRRQAATRQPRFTAPMVMIDQRPAEVADRSVPGHWEGDLIVGQGHGSAIGTLVERSSRFLVLVHLPVGHTAAAMLTALTDAMDGLPSALKRSLTWDQGVEMGAHHLFTEVTGIPVYFCQRASPWQRGSNENANGLLRQYFPKGSDLSAHSREYLDRVAASLNTRPRKTLGWQTPADLLHRQLAPAATLHGLLPETATQYGDSPVSKYA